MIKVIDRSHVHARIAPTPQAPRRQTDHKHAAANHWSGPPRPSLTERESLPLTHLSRPQSSNQTACRWLAAWKARTIPSLNHWACGRLSVCLSVKLVYTPTSHTRTADHRRQTDRHSQTYRQAGAKTALPGHLDGPCLSPARFWSKKGRGVVLPWSRRSPTHWVGEK